MENNAFVLYSSYANILTGLSMEDMGYIFKAILDYKATGEVNTLPSHLVIVFKFIKNQLDIDNEKYQKKIEKLKINGAKGGRPKNEKKPNGFLENQEKPNGFFKNHNDNENVNVNVNVNENVNVNANEKIKNKISSFRNPDLMFDEKIDKVFSLYEELCPNLASLVFERRNLERRQEVKDFLWLVQSNMDYVKGLFMRANEQRTFYDNPINFKALIKNHESIYQGLGKAKAPPKETGQTMKENFAKWQKEAEEREARQERERLNGVG